MTHDDAHSLVEAAGRAARAAAPSLAAAPEAALTHALHRMSELLVHSGEPVLEANAADLEALDPSFPEAMRDRLRLDQARMRAMADQIAILADAPFPEAVVATRDLGNGLVLEERRRPVGVIGANYEARPNVTIDVASQLVKSRNAGVLRTGGAALRSATALMDLVIAPSLRDAGLDGDAIQLVRTADRAGARALVSFPGLVPLVIIRGSGPTTRELSAHGAAHGVRILAHADGGGVLYLDAGADRDMARRLIRDSLDRLGVCNRLNLLLLDRSCWDELLTLALQELAPLGISASLPPHEHARGFEWALDEGNEAHVTIDAADSPQHAATIANDETSGLAAAIVTDDADAARAFLDAYAGTGAFWNATTRLLDGFKLLAAPETGINVDHVPGPRGPVTFRDLALRQFVVRPA
ncbi:MAG: aldehyde dehydrogenase family protein [Thermoleophilia bacterium]